MNNFISHAFANLLRGELHSFLLKNNSKSKKNKKKKKKKKHGKQIGSDTTGLIGLIVL